MNLSGYGPFQHAFFDQRISLFVGGDPAINTAHPDLAQFCEYQTKGGCSQISVLGILAHMGGRHAGCVQGFRQYLQIFPEPVELKLLPTYIKYSQQHCHNFLDEYENKCTACHGNEHPASHWRTAILSICYTAKLQMRAATTKAHGWVSEGWVSEGWGKAGGRECWS